MLASIDQSRAEYVGSARLDADSYMELIPEVVKPDGAFHLTSFYGRGLLYTPQRMCSTLAGDGSVVAWLMNVLLFENRVDSLRLACPPVDVLLSPNLPPAPPIDTAYGGKVCEKMIDFVGPSGRIVPIMLQFLWLHCRSSSWSMRVPLFFLFEEVAHRAGVSNERARRGGPARHDGPADAPAGAVCQLAGSQLRQAKQLLQLGVGRATQDERNAMLKDVRWLRDLYTEWRQFVRDGSEPYRQRIYKALLLAAKVPVGPAPALCPIASDPTIDVEDASDDPSL